MFNEMRQLVDELNKYRNAYYNDNTSLVSDKEYDDLFDKLADMEKTTGIVYADSPTQTVGYEVVSGLKKVKHNHPLLSLGKTTDIEEFAKYFGNKNVFLMGKMDGLTASIRYVGGKLVSAESRGNGEIGEDITHNAKVFANLPVEIPFPGELIVDGECIIDNETFKEIKKNENFEYKNPRNLVSGSVRQLNSSIAEKRKIRFIAWKLYSVIDENGKYLEYPKHFTDSFRFLKYMGFETVPYKSIYSIAPNKLTEYYESAINEIKEECEKLNYKIDGIVGAFEDVEYGNSLGSTGHHPKHSLAFKFYQDRNETTLLDIVWSTSRTGLVNPVAVFEPVEIDGTTVTRATLNNVSIIKELELGIGDTITIIKANEIIPQVTDNLTRSNTYVIPDVCPCCGKPLTVKNDTGREMLYCTNKNCSAINHDKISNFASREAMNIIGISEERLRVLMNKGYISTFSDIYNLGEYADRIEKMDGFGKSSVKKLLEAIEESKKCKFSNVLVAIGIPGIGKSTAKTISKYCALIKNKENILKLFIEFACDNYDWTSLDNFGITMSDAINKYVQDNYEEIIPLVDILEIAENDETQPQNNILGGKTFCITGKLNIYENRDKLVDDIEMYGGKVVSSVTSKTDYLITNEPDSGSSKNQKAQKYGTKIITEENFRDTILGLSEN